MPEWDAAQYLKFQEERTQPCRDLAARIATVPTTIADLGCGPGNSTEVIAARFPDAAITGLDSSPEMIATARKNHPGWNWVTEDIADFAGTPDLIFSNASLHWLPDHESLLPRLLHQSKTLAVQMPAIKDAPAHKIARSLLPGVREWHSHEISFYYDVLAPHSTRLDLWVTEYQHVLPNPEAIVEWYKGTGLRPYLQALPDEPARQAFLLDYTSEIKAAYPRRPDGKVIFPFRRVFFVAQASRPAN